MCARFPKEGDAPSAISKTRPIFFPLRKHLLFLKSDRPFVSEIFHSFYLNEHPKLNTFSVGDFDMPACMLWQKKSIDFLFRPVELLKSTRVEAELCHFIPFYEQINVCARSKWFSLITQDAIYTNSATPAFSYTRSCVTDDLLCEQDREIIYLGANKHPRKYQQCDNAPR